MFVTWSALAFSSLERPPVLMKRPGLAHSSLVLLRHLLK